MGATGNGCIFRRNEMTVMIPPHVSPDCQKQYAGTDGGYQNRSVHIELPELSLFSASLKIQIGASVFFRQIPYSFQPKEQSGGSSLMFEKSQPSLD